MNPLRSGFYLLVSLLTLLIFGACGSRDPFVRMAREKDSAAVADAADPQRAAERRPGQAGQTAREAVMPLIGADIPARSPRRAPREGRIHINSLGRLRDLFNDSNKYQYAFAEKIGIRPMEGVADAYFTSRPVVRIESCDLYTVDSLTHSMPFLVPEAATLLEDIGRGFRDSLKSRGAKGYRIRVTSLLRTPHTVKRLRRINRNATDSSTHQFATTFDISYARFDCFDSTRVVVQEDLKNLLAEVLWDLRRQEKCLVKFERKSPCFHITATGK